MSKVAVLLSYVTFLTQHVLFGPLRLLPLRLLTFAGADLSRPMVEYVSGGMVEYVTKTIFYISWSPTCSRVHTSISGHYRPAKVRTVRQINPRHL